MAKSSVSKVFLGVGAAVALLFVSASPSLAGGGFSVSVGFGGGPVVGWVGVGHRPACVFGARVIAPGYYSYPRYTYAPPVVTYNPYAYGYGYGYSQPQVIVPSYPQAVVPSYPQVIVPSYPGYYYPRPRVYVQPRIRPRVVPWFGHGHYRHFDRYEGHEGRGWHHR